MKIFLLKMIMRQENAFSKKKSKINNAENNDAQRGQIWFSSIFQ